MNWKNLKPNHFYKDPVEHIYVQNFFPKDDYEKLYENQGNLEHQAWQDFDAKYKVGYELFDNLQEVNYNKEVIALWFFKDRNDKSAGTKDISLLGKEITYTPNTLLLTTSKDIKFNTPQKRKWINRPVLQLDLPLATFNNICEALK